LAWNRAFIDPKGELVPQTAAAPQTFAERQQRSLELALAAARAIADNRGQNVVVLDLREQTAIFDYFVIATGTSQRQLRAMCDAVNDVLAKQLGDRRLSIEGYEQSRWILSDYGSVVVHLFSEEAREFYGLEDLWAGATRVDLAATA
jgi:ribosome-associated protein